MTTITEQIITERKAIISAAERVVVLRQHDKTLQAINASLDSSEDERAAARIERFTIEPLIQKADQDLTEAVLTHLKSRLQRKVVAAGYVDKSGSFITTYSDDGRPASTDSAR